MEKKEKLRPIKPLVLVVGEIEGFDFTERAKYIFNVLQILKANNLLSSVSYCTIEEVKETIHRLVADIDFNSDKHQVSECGHIRIEYTDELFSLQLYLNV